MPKRAYQIKLNKKANFLGIGESKEKKWVLIANYRDPTVLKNKKVNDLCVNIGLSNCPNSSFADLYVNGDYVGNYLVCDKIEINKNRVNLEDDNGVLVELDNAYYNEEDYWFKSNRGTYYSIKEAYSEDPIVINNAMNSFKKALNKFQSELYSDNPSWEKISKMIDVESFAKYYLVNEFAENADSYFSSCYLYKDGENDVIHMGPIWDYDDAFGYSKTDARGENPMVDFTLMYACENDMRRLYIFPQFADLVDETYKNELKPLLDELNVKTLSKNIENSAKINAIRWSTINTYQTKVNELNTYIEKRKKYFNNRYLNNQIQYSTHIQSKGWKQAINSGVSGTEGKSLRLEGFRATVGNDLGEDVSISYRTHIQDIGWQDWKKDGQIAGTTGQCLRIEAIQILIEPK